MKVKLVISLTSLKTRCQLEYYKFPYDKQICTIEVGSWQHNSERIDFDSDDGDIDIKYTLKNNIWNMQSVVVTAIPALLRFPDDQQASDVVYTLYLKRRPNNYMLNNIFPTWIISCVTLIAFNYRYAQQVGISEFFKRILHCLFFKRIILMVIIYLKKP